MPNIAYVIMHSSQQKVPILGAPFNQNLRRSAGGAPIHLTMGDLDPHLTHSDLVVAKLFVLTWNECPALPYPT